MQYKKEHLDMPFSKLIDCENDETPRQFILASEEEFGIHPKNVESMSDDELNGYIDFLDYLWTK